MFQQLLVELARALNRREIEYMIIGGQAVLIYGEFRLTRDIDITLGVGEERLQEILDLATELRLHVSVEHPQEFVRDTMVLPCLDPASDIRIDFIFSNSEYERQALQRVHRVSLGEEEICYASLEDLVIHKMITARPRDLEDVRSILLKNQNVDQEYIQSWLGQFEEALDMSFLSMFETLWKETQKKL